MEIIAIILIVIVALLLLKVLGYLAPFIFVAAIIVWAKNNGWSNEAIGFAAFVIFAGSIAAYAYFKKSMQPKKMSIEELQEWSARETERLNKVYGKDKQR